MAKNNSLNNGDRHKIHEIFLTNFFFRYNSSLTNSTQLSNDSTYSKFNGENIATNCSVVTALALDGLTKKQFGHYALFKIFSLRSPSMIQNAFYFLKDGCRKCPGGHFTVKNTGEEGWLDSLWGLGFWLGKDILGSFKNIDLDSS